MSEPQRPAAAYAPVAELLGDRFLVEQPPAAGVRLVIVGDDGIETQWDMGRTMARVVARSLARRKTGPRVVRTTLYDDRVGGYQPGAAA